MALTQVSPGLLDSNSQRYGFKNRIINGAMVIDQRNAGASVTPAGTYTLDRWICHSNTDGAYTFKNPWLPMETTASSLPSPVQSFVLWIWIFPTRLTIPVPFETILKSSLAFTNEINHKFVTKKNY